jgi:acyl carrier protein
MSSDKIDPLKSPLFNRIATDLYDPEQVLKAIETQKRRPRPELEADFTAPRNAMEQEVADIWAGLLGVERVGVHDNFFKLGGHSILATQLLSRVRERFEVDVPMRTVFEVPTVANLVVQIIQGRAGQLDSAEMEKVLAELEQEESRQSPAAGEPDAA